MNQIYQEFCKKGLKVGNDNITFALGLAGETGEVLDLIKKARRDQLPVDMVALKEELGDVLWYITNLCDSYGFTLDEIMQGNICKLKERYGIKDE